MAKYNFRKIEKNWQKKWAESGIFKAPDEANGKKNFYHLVMFPYPSGDLHIGHWYNFAPADVYARFKRMQGFNVMSPIGFDAFGLPAENAALKHGIHPEKWTMQNIKTMTAQLESMGNSYDWSRLVITCLPEYYKWNQWFFLKFFKRGLAYRKKAPANWCTSCKTVLANEQVVDGACERCGSAVIQKEMEQWLLKVTDYAERLLNDLDKLDWPERTKIMQRNWIGKSEGAEIKFQIPNSKFQIPVFTTRPDTILGATYVVLAPEHPLIKNLEFRIQNMEEVDKYIKKASYKTEHKRIAEAGDKTGVELKGVKAINPATKKEIPIWISDYVLISYGTGAIMAVPAHDQRDREFAEKFNLPIADEPLVDKDKIVKKVGGKKTVQYRLRDWLISRQRYWGTPIPIIYCDKCGVVPVPEKDLPVLLPPLKDFKPADDGRSPLARSEKFLKTKCPECKGPAERETDTMDTFFDSSWYFLRYADPKNDKKAFDKSKVKKWLPVNMYIGGAEHTVLHLLYARFFTKFLYDEGLVDFQEPFLALRHQGIILGPDGQKMSKSRGNVVDPDNLVKEFGSDSVRMYLCFMGEYSQGGPWQPNGIIGVHRFLQRVWRLCIEANKRESKRELPRTSASKELEKLLHKTIKKIGEDIENFKFNTAVSALMILLNEMEKQNNLPPAFCRLFLKLLAPFAPHMAEELWMYLGNSSSVHAEKWPEYDLRLVKEEKFILVIQINGKVRDSVEMSADITEEEVKELTLKREKIGKYLGSKKPRKIIYIPRRLINIVV